MQLRLRSVLAAVFLFGALPPAYAQVDSREGITLQNEIYQLRQELQQLQSQGGRGGGGGQSYSPPPAPSYSGSNGDLVTQLLTRADALEQQVREQRGRIDELQNQLERQNADLGKRIDDLSFQVNPQGGQPGGGPVPGQSAPNQEAPPPPPYSGTLAMPGTPPPLPTTQRPIPLPGAPAQPLQAAQRPPGPRTPERALQDGNAALAHRDYTQAEAAAREVLANRTSPRAYDAQLLLAHSLAGEHQYPQAAIAYDDAYNRARTGSHAQDALIGLAGSLSAINEKKAACDTLSRLRSEFPQPRADIKASSVVVAQRAGCH